VLVTGAHGFIGSWLVGRLLDEGAEVVAPLRRARAGALPAPPAARVELVDIDLVDPVSVARALNEHDIGHVFHLAAHTSVADATADPYQAFDVNVRGTYALLEAARGARADGLDVRVVVASTYHVYGAAPRERYDEDTPLDPLGVYDASKACADALARSYAVTYSMPVAVTRLANVYGGGDTQPTRLVPAAARALAAGDAPVLRSHGRQERDFVYVADAVDAYLRVAESLGRHELWGRAWNAGSGRPVAIGEVVRRLIAVSGRDVEPRIDARPDPSAVGDRRYLDTSAIRAELGWEPAWSLDGGLTETYRWYESAA
jgi:CDP-glucose 4,6-dehydratase